MTHHDLVIIGSGFGGSLLAQIARRLGLSVLLLEKGRHPRFAIGESTSPLANLLIEQLAERYDLPRLLPLTAYGPWQRAYPEVSCGLKRGFTYYHHEAGRPYRMAADRSNQLMVAASPCDEVADTHWFRSDVDHFLLQEAVALGAKYLDEAQVSLAGEPSRDGTLLRVGRHGTEWQAHARLLVDASGPRGFLHRALAPGEREFAGYPPTQTLFSHFTGVRRCDGMDDYAPPAGEHPPYPADDAALHHVFDGGWMWVLRFNNGVTSVGVACTDTLAGELRLAEREPAWARLMERFPSVGAQMRDSRAVQPFVYGERLAWRSAAAAGDGWVMLPSAAAFVDPLFSTGIPLTLLGIERIAGALENDWETDRVWERLRDVGETALAEADHAAQLVRGSYGGFREFRPFAELSMFYFAAASYSEMARRIPGARNVGRFLAQDRPEFTQALYARVEEVVSNAVPADFSARIAAGVEPFNIAGLCRPEKRHWYGVDMADVIEGAEKLGLTHEVARRIIETAPWALAALQPA